MGKDVLGLLMCFGGELLGLQFFLEKVKKVYFLQGVVEEELLGIFG